MKPLNQYPKHKRKKIEYIRQKFVLRNGGIVRSYFKISKAVTIDINALKQCIEEQIHETCIDLFSKWKLTFVCKNIEIGYNDNDFIQNLQTVLITYKVYR